VTVAHLGKNGEADDEEESEESVGPDIEEVGKLLLGQIIKKKGVQAVSIFGRGTNVLSIGDVNLESLVILAEDMLQTAKNISSVIDTGSFVHLTLQIPGGTVIITPYYDEYLCILTTSGVNLGQIRKILRDIHASQLNQEVKME
jgi:predicted regulator of Ras-like GTPase activity (Roadblock/LC7/MglB family)